MKPYVALKLSQQVLISRTEKLVKNFLFAFGAADKKDRHASVYLLDTYILTYSLHQRLTIYLARFCYYQHEMFSAVSTFEFSF